MNLVTSVKSVLRRITSVESRAIQRFMAEVASREVGRGAFILDVGAGSSPYRRFFQECRYISTDSFLCNSDLGFVADAHELSVIDKSFDVVLSNQMLEHVADPERALREFYRVLKPGGKLILTAPQAWQLHQEPHHYFNFTKYGLALLFQRVGFQVKQIEARGGISSSCRTRFVIRPRSLNTI